MKLIFFISIIKINFFIWLVINEKPSSGIIHQSKLSLLGCSHTHKNYSPTTHLPLHHPFSWTAWKGWEKPKEMDGWAHLFCSFCSIFLIIIDQVYFWWTTMVTIFVPHITLELAIFIFVLTLWMPHFSTIKFVAENISS